MRKIIFILILSFLFFSCTFFEEKQEEITFYLPDFPSILNEFSDLEFAFWQIQYQNSKGKFYEKTYDNKIIIKTNKNEPLSVLAFPIIILPDKTFSQFFKPCGTIYPYDYDDFSQTLTWENGFCANLINMLFDSSAESNLSTSQINDFLKTFNWKKMMQSISKTTSQNYEEILSSSSNKFYNPWQIDISKLLENLSTKKFTSSLLKTTSLYSFSKEDFNFSENDIILSSYVPENIILKEKTIFTLKKDFPSLFLFNNFYGTLITASSSKKISVQWTYMPTIE